MTKKEIKQHDKEFAEKIKERANYKCEKCGDRKGHLNCHHIFNRRNRTVRWDVDNGICCCPNCHFFSNQSAHSSPAFIFWLIEKRGQKWWKRLLKKAKGE